MRHGHRYRVNRHRGSIGADDPKSVEGTDLGLAALIGRFFAVVVLWGVPFAVFGADADAIREEAVKNPWQLLLRQQASDYVVKVLTADGPRTAELLPQPISLWTQPVRGGEQGAVFLWTDDFHPVLIGTLFLWPRETTDGQVLVNAHELESLSNQAVQTQFGETTWTAPADTFSWQSFLGVSTRVANRRNQSLQLRALLKQLSATRQEPTGEETHLRLLPQPLYVFPTPIADGVNLVNSSSPEKLSGQSQPRGAATNSEEASTRIPERPIGGAVWGFVDGTDLEIVVLTEARPSDAGPAWQFTAARMSDRPLRLMLNELTVWSVGSSRYGDRSGTYFVTNVAEWDPVSGEQR